MKKFFVYGLVGFGVSFVGIAILGYAIEADRGYSRYGQDDSFALIAWTVVAVCTVGSGIYGWMKTERKSFSDVAAAPISKAKQFRESVTDKVASDYSDYYAIAEEEIESGNLEKGLWAKALINVKGDESKRKVEYMELRARQLRRYK